MGTRLDIVFPGIPDDVADGFSLEARTALNTLERKISIYKDNSVFSRLNRFAYKEPQPVEQDMFHLVRDLKALSFKTAGYFDFTLGKLGEWMKLYANQGIETDLDFDDLLSGFGAKHIVLDSSALTISFSSDKVFLDSGGFGKGMGLDMVRKALQIWQIESAFISFGESSILAHGRHPYGKTWKTGIRNVFDENEHVYTFDLQDEVMSVSGITPENLKKYGQGHIMNPHTGLAINKIIQAGVAGPAGFISEALSTVLICAPEEARSPVMEAFPEYRAVIISYDENRTPEIAYTFNDKMKDPHNPEKRLS